MLVSVGPAGAMVARSPPKAEVPGSKRIDYCLK